MEMISCLSLFEANKIPIITSEGIMCSKAQQQHACWYMPQVAALELSSLAERRANIQFCFSFVFTKSEICRFVR